MLAVFGACFVFRCLLIVAADVIPPQNVDVNALNTCYTLKWDWDQRAAENHSVSFTTQYIMSHMVKRPKHKWATLCENTSQKSCDLTASALKYQNAYRLRVRADVDKDHSAWVEKEFCPERDANLGPPDKVRIAPAGSDLEVNITDPLSSNNSSMKNYVESMYYRIIYWESSPDPQALAVQTLCTSANLVTLPHLKARTHYCVKVQSRDDYYNKTSNFTTPQCMQTEGPTPLWQILLCLIVSMVVCFLLVGLILLGFFKFSWSLKRIFYPPIELPAHFQEHFCDSFSGSDIPPLLPSELEDEVNFDKLSICPDSALLEIHDPPPCEPLPAPSLGLEPHSSGRHARQDSGGSQDSGVYSTESGSRQQQQLSGTQSCTEPDVSWHGTSDVEQVKMLDLGSSVKNHNLIEDEGIVDFCV
ncbi:LOW QUALITY PROTEIN: interleukin-10 receptor subunit beta [Thalassophryne amazonica]|uniref:LOW QUALITY PROTEIN: interleukin-10 receptor subunit beta n=1 Tax=Thalassophryne amazonica TaxID=390379 RepID=UPI00147183C2|nr:LOW QUALITY PROTEIN: interleukin-10 receptor subunit beta [Thalassophryne amazonica]